MKKIDMRDWVASLEEMINNKLKKWDRGPKIENGEAVKLRWYFEQTDISLDIFWEDNKELVQMTYKSPREDFGKKCSGLTDETFNDVQDRIGNWAQKAMYRYPESNH